MHPSALYSYLPRNLLTYHRPKLNLQDAPIPSLKPESRRCIQALASYHPSAAHNKLPKYPREKSAAVLVALFVGRMGDLYVLLSRRAPTLRSYAGDTSLPGGKVDSEDKTMEDTARREAFEEIGLPPDKTKVPLLCVLEPFIAGGDVLVTPVVVLILDNTLRPILNTAEVAQLFSHPLISFLSSDSPFPTEPEAIQLPYHTYVDMPWSGSPRGQIRLHRFLTGREAGGVKPIYGLTAEIMIRVARIGYKQRPDFDLRAINQPSTSERVIHALKHKLDIREAAIREGIDVDSIHAPSSKVQRNKPSSRRKLKAKM